MKSNRTFLAVIFLLLAVGASVFACKEYVELIQLRAKLGGPAGVDKQLTDAQKRIRALEDELAALRKSGTATDLAAEDAGPEATGPGADGGNADRRARFEAMRAIFNSPQFQALRAIQDKSQIEQRYAALFKSLNLTPAQVTAMENLLVQKQQAMEDAAQAARAAGIDPRKDPTGYQQAIADAQSDVNKQLQATLGDTGYAAYQSYSQTLPQRATVTQLQTSLSYSPTPLTDEQSAALISLMQQNQPLSTNGGFNRGGGGGGPFGGAAITPATVTAAAGILSAPQLQALQQLQQAQQAQAKMQQLFQANRAQRGNAKGG